MAVQWYPGHMFKASKEIKQALPGIDVIIEVLDARIPYSSENPVIGQFQTEKPYIKILNKCDLADPEMTAYWQEYFEKQGNVQTLALSTEKPARVKQISDLCKKFAAHKVVNEKAIYTMIMGIPNVGKSTLINILAGRMIAKTGNEPAVTKRQQRIRLDDNIYLSDTPGILWPKVDSDYSSYRLAMTGAIKDTAMEYDDVAVFAAEYFLQACPDVLMKRYRCKELPNNAIALLEVIGRLRGCLSSGGLVDLQKASVMLINDYRMLHLGRMTLETPEMIAVEELEVAKVKAEKEAIKEARKSKRAASRKKT